MPDRPYTHVPEWGLHLPAGCSPDQVELLEHGSLPARWLARWRKLGPSPQLQDTDGSWLSAEQLEERTGAIALRLQRTGLAPEERLLIVSQSSAAFLVAYIGAVRAGLTVVPLNPAYTRREIGAIVADCEPAAAVTQSDEHARWIRQAAGRDIPVLGLPLELAHGAEAELDRAGGEDTALLVYTSGTTGAPKGVPLSQRNLLASASAVALAWRWTADDRLLLALPLFHIHGLGVGVNGSLCTGGAITLRERFDPADVATRCRQGATLFFGVPTMFRRLADSGQAPALRALRLLVSGSAPLPEKLAHEIADQAGQLPLERYGMTETGMLAGNPYDGQRRPGTVGFPFPGVELRLGEQDEIQVRGPNVFSGYLNRPESSTQAFTSDGWFGTGDLGELDGDGYLRLVARSKELIITGGYNVYPREVEEALGSHPAVREVAVIGRPSERWGEEVTAVVVAEGRVDEQELRRHAAGSLAHYKVPKRVEFTPALPRSAMGKVLRAEL